MNTIFKEISAKFDNIFKDKNNIEKLKDTIDNKCTDSNFDEILLILKELNGIYYNVTLYHSISTELKYQLFHKYKNYLYPFLTSNGIKRYIKWLKLNDIKNKQFKIELNDFSYKVFEQYLKQSNSLDASNAIEYHKQLEILYSNNNNINGELLEKFNNLIYDNTVKSQKYLKSIVNYNYLGIISHFIKCKFLNYSNISDNNLDLLINLNNVKNIINKLKLPIIPYMYILVSSDVPILHSTSKFNTKKMSYTNYVYIHTIIVFLKYLDKIGTINKSLKDMIINLEQTLSKVVETKTIITAKKDIQQFYKNCAIYTELANDTKRSTTTQ